MLDKPLVSVIMSTYNEKVEWLDKAVKSILNQTYENFEFIIVIDNPFNEKIVDYVSSLRDNRIVIIKNETNMGLVKSLNNAIEFTEGKYIARMDADDISFATRFEKQVTFMEKNKNVVLLGAKANYIDENDKKLTIDNEFVVGFDRIKEKLKYGSNAMIHPTYMIRQEIIKSAQINKYRHVYSAEDYDLVCRLVCAGHMVENLDEVLLSYRIRSNGISISDDYGQYRVSLYISQLYRKNKLDELNYDKIKAMKINYISKKLFEVGNILKNKTLFNIECTNYPIKLLGKVISRYQLIRAVNNLIWRKRDRILKKHQ